MESKTLTPTRVGKMTSTFFIVVVIYMYTKT